MAGRAGKTTARALLLTRGANSRRIPNLFCLLARRTSFRSIGTDGVCNPLLFRLAPVAVISWMTDQVICVRRGRALNVYNSTLSRCPCFRF